MTTKAKFLILLAALFSVGTVAHGQTFSYPSEDYWKDPEHVKEFLGTYGFLSPVEPTISADEKKLFTTLIEQLQTDKNLALKTLTEAIKPTSSSALNFTLGNLYVELGKQDLALESYKAAIKKFPSFLRAYKNLGILNVQMGQFKEAIKNLSKAVNLGAVDSLTYGLLGLSFLNTGNHLSAEAAYRQAIIFDPSTFDWKLGLARTLVEEQKYKESISILDELIKLRPDNADLWLYQANAYIGNEQPAKAAANYEIVRLMGKASAQALMNLGDIYMNEDLKELAANCYLDALKKNPNQSADRPIHAAEILTSRGSNAEAQKLIDQINTNYKGKLTDSQDLNVLRIQSRIEIATGSAEKAAPVLEKIVERDPLDGEALMLLAAYYNSKGEIERAEMLYDRAAGISKYQVPALINHAQMLVSQGKYSKAVPLLEQAQRLKPQDNVARYLEQVRRAAQDQRSL